MIAGYSLIRVHFCFFKCFCPRFTFYENITLYTPLTAGLESLQATLGPFGAVDMIYISCPNTYTTQVPEEFLNNSSIGGNLLCCVDMSPMPTFSGISSYFRLNNMCHSQFGEFAWRSNLMLLFANIPSQITINLNASDYNQLCALQLISGDDCMYMYTQDELFIKEYPIYLEHSTTQAYQDIKALDIRFIQYVLIDNSTTHLYNIPIFSKAERLFGFFAWCLIYEWATGLREVISF
ncbi:hypothetical protein THRCLA_03428 [Thraustotheca clavata]|uniref:Uncharacterized protein n=1 Tax=Thraustotheca clavata TaxID=74557 RepID=A0A1W0A233_9STRA|nr:hypothetical protein THRCLA_03428 [Thraustotheca clavata]